MAKRKHSYGTPFRELLPPLSTTERAALEADIKAHGVRNPCLIDEEDNILDGHNRLDIDPDAHCVVISGLSPAQKEAFVLRSGNCHRNQSPEQKAETREKMKQTAFRLREEDPKRWTQKRVADELGVGRQTVSDWFSNNAGTGNATKPSPDARVKLPEPAQEVVADLVSSGKSQQQVAADFGVSQKTVSNVVRKVAKKREKEQERQEKAEAGRRLVVDGFHVGDFREVAETIADDSVPMIFTDPPYHREHLELYEGIAEVGARVLQEGGSLLCYCGQYLMPEILEAMTPHLRLWWVCGVRHTEQKARMNEYGIVVNWKPVLWFVKKTRGDKRTFVDDLVDGVREKGSHDWQQAVVEAAYFIEKLTSEDDVVFDPFCGGGTTAIACKEAQRRILTCDIDEQTLNVAKERYSNQ